jgi:hypothetical protein
VKEKLFPYFLSDKIKEVGLSLLGEDRFLMEGITDEAYRN